MKYLELKIPLLLVALACSGVALGLRQRLPDASVGILATIALTRYDV
jgi:hypothetical protein